MPNLPSKEIIQEITESAHIPAIGYAYVEPKKDSEHEFASNSFSFGKKNATETKNSVNADTRFPAASLSKVVFTYLVLQLVNEGYIELDEPLHKILQYERFKINDEYPEKAKQLTARHVLSHTTGLPNVEPDLSSKLSFDDKSILGTKYSYSGEAFIYLQKVIETQMSKVLKREVDLEMLAKKYVFDPLEMGHSTFLPQREDDTEIVAVHSHLGKPISIHESIPHLRYDLELRSSLSDLSQAEKGKIYLSENPREYYIKGMSGPAPIPLEIDLTNLTTKLNNRSFRSDILAMTSKASHTPHLNAAGSLLTTADDFSKFMAAWLKNMNAPTFRQAFEPGYYLSLMSITSFDKLEISKLDQKPYLIKDDQGKYKLWGYKENKWQLTDIGNLEVKFEWKQDVTVFISPKDEIFNTLKNNHTPKCGLGWHIYKNKEKEDEVIAYQYGENTDMRSFVAINVDNKKGVAIFTNSEHGMCVGNQLLRDPIGNMQAVFKNLNYSQSDELGWQEMLEGEIAEDKGNFAKDRGNVEEARRCFAKARSNFEKALERSPADEYKQRRLEWFNAVHSSNPENQEFNHRLETFVGKYKNPHEVIEISIRDGNLIHKQFGHETKLVRISETNFVTEKNQSFQLSIKEGQMSVLSIEGWKKSLDKQPMQKSQFEYKNAVTELRESHPDYLESTRAKEEEIHSTTNPHWKQ
ncbi:serine hydrolase domain-containing protein [Legionella fallonii]|uniref:Beta-lactamase-related domain-containing protein n=1 Tax=Legionella fallonii LLAP-10 TaxID=1212491 RepID=A0A098G5W5_9GAMM|nr:serine hydrolase domain-containing protein [Legionella fallonii]CEG57847.1 conserved protein of unknown function [Beta-lactamase domain] [Legionella fallonii LLAP-10]